MKLLTSVKASWQTLVVVLTPLLLCPFVFPYADTSQESKCASLIALMAIYWITESLPLPVTSLLPLVVCPLLGIASSRQICKAFFGDTTFLLIGGIIVAIAIEECNLHKRLALRILMLIGIEPRRLMLGIMLTTAFLSMWISNTATTAMMMPITRFLLAKLFIAKRVAQRQLSSDYQDFSAGDGQSPAEDRMIPSTAKLNPVEAYKLEMTERKVDSPTRCYQAQHRDQGGKTCLRVGENTLPWNKDESCRSQQGQQEQPENEADQVESRADQLESGADQPTVSCIKKTTEAHDEGEDEKVLKNLDAQSHAILKAFCLCVCYSANVGGMATLTGTPPNMVLSRMAADLSKTSAVNFTNWMAFSLPISILILIGCYIWMNINVFGFWNTLMCKSISTKQEVIEATQTIRLEYKKLGRVRFSEVVVMIHFLVMVALFLTRDPGSFDGWSVIFKSRFVSDGSTALTIAISLFIFPNQRPNILFFRRKGDPSPARSCPSILSWREMSRKFPWGLVLLIGGGFSLSEASKVSGLSKEIANKLMFIDSLPVWAAGLVVTAVTSLVTEITSNTVVVMLLLPILRDLAGALNVHPLYLMLPATLASSLAFMLPVATPPNAVVFAFGDMRVIDMIKYGAALNLLGIIVIFLALNTWGSAIYNLNTLPDWTLRAGLSGIAANFTMTSLNLSNVTVTPTYLSNFTLTPLNLSNFTDWK